MAARYEPTTDQHRGQPRPGITFNNCKYENTAQCTTTSQHWQETTSPIMQHKLNRNIHTHTHSHTNVYIVQYLVQYYNIEMNYR
uniref:Uncharacterized protein n=1 Tax=Anguilla anguilla TaxID=7936 RepID=A0A0E9WQ95_ANGAN